MELKETLVAISDDARGWLKTWARNFTDAEAVQPRSDSRAPNPAEGADLDRGPRVPNPFFRSLGQAVYEAALHENYHVGEIAALRKALGKPRIG